MLAELGGGHMKIMFCTANNKPAWPNGYGISFLNRRLGVQVPPWVITLFSQLFLFNQWFYLFSCCSYECLVSFSIQFISVTTQIYSFTLFDLLVYVKCLILRLGVRNKYLILFDIFTNTTVWNQKRINNAFISFLLINFCHWKTHTKSNIF